MISYITGTLEIYHQPFDTSGNYTRVDTGSTTWRDDAAAGTKIRADLHDNHDNDVASALSGCITRAGYSAPTADLPMAGFKLTNVGTPVAAGDVATKSY